jgi:superoxide dismutase, Fe-Mn family
MRLNMRGNSACSLLLLSAVLNPSQTFALEQAQQPFEFGEMAAPTYNLPPLPYAYDVSG